MAQLFSSTSASLCTDLIWVLVDGHWELRHVTESHREINLERE